MLCLKHNMHAKYLVSASYEQKLKKHLTRENLIIMSVFVLFLFSL
jgi:hypothetical protein